MPTVVPPEATGDERGALLAYLEAQRGAIRRVVHGLTEEQARSKPTVSAFSLSGVVKHVTYGEVGWLRKMTGTGGEYGKDAQAEWEDSFVPHEDETVPVLLERYAEAARAFDAAVRAVPSLDDTFELPKAPWDAGGPRSWRWAVLHLIEETCRHAGHADIIRETVDGKGAFDLVFETGAMPEPDWSVLDE